MVHTKLTSIGRDEGLTDFYGEGEFTRQLLCLE
jgi:hypothetical protein